MNTQRKISWLAAAIVGLSVGVVEPLGTFLGRDAHAVVGRPLTPVSYAGVARRTTRRTVRRTAYATDASTPAVVVAPTTTLPDGCTQTGGGGGSVQYTCGSTQYEPYYDGPNVVYEQVQ